VVAVHIWNEARALGGIEQSLLEVFKQQHELIQAQQSIQKNIVQLSQYQMTIQGGCVDLGGIVVSVREALAGGWCPTTPEEEDDDHVEASLAVLRDGEAAMGNLVASSSS
jgi:hypothetical protein